MRSHYGKLSFLLVAILLANTSLFSQKFEIKNYNSESGLPQDYIYALAQDSAGYLWIGSGAGLSKYDGKSFRNYSSEDGLAEDFIKVLYSTPDAQLWIGHYEGGISYIDNGKIGTIKKPEENYSPITTIIHDSDNNIWAGTMADGLLLINDGIVLSFKNDSILSRIYSIQEVKPKTFLIATDAGVFLYKLEGKKLVLALNKPVFDQACQFIIKDEKSKSYFFISKEGMFRYSSDSSPSLTEISFPPDFSFDQINNVYSDQTSALFISTHGKGVYKIRVDNHVVIIEEHIGTQAGLNTDYIRSVLVDREYNIWIGSYGGGLSKIENPQFKTYEFFKDSQHVSPLFQDKRGAFWMAGKAALGRVDIIDGDKILVPNIPLPADIGNVTCLEETGDNEILIGTENQGVHLFNRTDNTFRQYFYQQNRPLTNKVNDLLLDSDGNIWIATYEGVFLMNKAGTIQREITIADGLLHNVINTIYSDQTRNIWILTEGAGLSKYKDDKIETFKLRGQVNFNINCITEDKEGRLWIGLDGGGVYSFSKGKFNKLFDKERGLLSNYINAIVSDYNNNLWIVQSDGITKYNTSLRQFTHFRTINGMLVKSIRSNSVVKSNNGKIYWATEGNVVEYAPDIDALTLAYPLLKIKGIELFFQKMDWDNAGEAYDRNNPPLALILKHSQNHLNFRFEAISFRSEQIQYRYKLEGFDQKWSLSTTQNFATYANLPPGEYTFKVSALSFGQWSNTESVSFRILNPFWKTWWFIVLVVILIVSIAGSIIYFRISLLKRKQRFLEEQRAMLMAEIRERKIAERKMKESETKLKVTNEKLVKSGQELNTFIYRSAHDLKGPLMSIIGLTNLGKMETRDQLTGDYFSKIAHSALRLDGILKVLSTVTEIKDWEVDVRPVDFASLMTQLLEEFKESFDVSLVQFRSEVSSAFHSDLQLITIIMRALLDNSFKYTNPSETDHQIKIHIGSRKKGVQITVEDNGLGIEKQVIGNVFNMFFKGTERSKGFGLGLYVVNNCVEKLNGKCSIESEQYRGTKVTIYLPDYNNYLSIVDPE